MLSSLGNGGGRASVCRHECDWLGRDCTLTHGRDCVRVSVNVGVGGEWWCLCVCD